MLTPKEAVFAPCNTVTLAGTLKPEAPGERTTARFAAAWDMVMVQVIAEPATGWVEEHARDERAGVAYKLKVTF